MTGPVLVVDRDGEPAHLRVEAPEYLPFNKSFIPSRDTQIQLSMVREAAAADTLSPGPATRAASPATNRGGPGKAGAGPPETRRSRRGGHRGNTSSENTVQGRYGAEISMEFE